MKTKLIFKLLFICSILFSGNVFGQKQSKEQLLSLYNIIENKDFKFEADDMNTPTLGFNAITSEPNTVTIKNDSIFVDLPFWGKAYRADFNNEGGFHFEGLINIREKKLTKRKHLIIYKLEYKTSEDNVKLIFYLSETQFSSLKIISQNRESIDYTGRIEYLDSKNK